MAAKQQTETTGNYPITGGLMNGVQAVGGNLLFVDGHVEYRKGSQLVSGYFGFLPDNNHWGTSVSDPILNVGYTSQF